MTESQQATSLPDSFRILIVILYQGREGLHKRLGQIVNKDQRFGHVGKAIGHKIFLMDTFLATRDMIRLRKAITCEPLLRGLHRRSVSASHIPKRIAPGNSCIAAKAPSTGTRSCCTNSAYCAS